MNSRIVTLTDADGSDVKVVHQLRDNLMCTQCGVKYMVKKLNAVTENALRERWRMNIINSTRKRTPIQPVSYGLCKSCLSAQYKVELDMYISENRNEAIYALDESYELECDNYLH